MLASDIRLRSSVRSNASAGTAGRIGCSSTRRSRDRPQVIVLAERGAAADPHPALLAARNFSLAEEIEGRAFLLADELADGLGTADNVRRQVGNRLITHALDRHDGSLRQRSRARKAARSLCVVRGLRGALASAASRLYGPRKPPLAA